MKEGIHPQYTDAEIECACGFMIKTKSTRGSFKVDICSNCHPFYTGKQKLLDSAGRIDKFRRKYGRSAPAVAEETTTGQEAKAAGGGDGSAS